MTTKENLEVAFAGESKASQKYKAFAVVADKEGLSQIAKLFRAAAYAEEIHAQNHLRAGGFLASTAENLKEAIKGETYEFEQMYPPMVKQAITDNSPKAKQSMTFALEVEKGHEQLYDDALRNIGNNTATDYFVCTVCGYTHAGENAPDKCPICSAPAKAFRRVD